MTKFSSRDILDILRLFNIAKADNTPRQIELIKIFNPSNINTLISFKFLKEYYCILSDTSANDDEKYILSEIKKIFPNINGEVIKNPTVDFDSFGVPNKKQDCYLFKSVSNKIRLDIKLSTEFPKFSRNIWQKYIKAGYISVNNKIITTPKHEMNIYDKLSVNLPKEKNYDDIEFPIIYIDDNVIVINKPDGILAHSKGVLNDEFTVADFFRRYTNYNLDTNRPGIVHRLDRDTSGVMIGARNANTAKMLQKQFSERKTKKVYFAVINGVPKLSKANIDLPIKRSTSQPSTFRVDVNGKSAMTNYEIISTVNNKSLIKLEPQTGRTHQLRVHMKYLNTPIIGDKVYGKKSNRMYLHAYSLEITIPTYGRKIFTSPIPIDFINKFPKADIA